MAKKTQVPDFLQTRLAELEEARRKILDEKGLKPFFTLPQGDTVIDIDLSVKPRLTPNGKNAYRVTVDGQENDMPMTTQLEMKVLRLIQSEGKHVFVFTRVGAGQTDTRYSVRVAE